MKKVLLITVSLAIPVLLLIGCTATRAGYESAPYSVVKTSGKFEIRDYPAMLVASTPMKSEDPNEDDGSFMRLFRYISKDNQSETKISMTTPVFMKSGDSGKEMSFVMPAKMADSGAPVPNSEKVTVETMEGGRFAVYRYSGSWKPAVTEDARKKLQDWMIAEKFTGLGKPEVAHYDPPFTPPFLRRNEIRVRVSAE